MKIPVVLLSLVVSPSTVVPSANAAGFRELVERVTRRKTSAAAATDVAAAAADADAAGLQDEQEGRQLQSSNCWSDKTPAEAWHPVYSAGWTNGYCRFTIDCNSPSYSTEAACCKAAYAGQATGYCLQQLPSPPTTSPTDAGGLDVYYPDYDTAWTEAGCTNKRPMPSGRPTYSTMVACCKGAYGGQVSGKCLSMLPSPPTTSPTTSGGMADFWYPDYDTAWSVAGCSNKLPLPYRNKNDRPNYSSQVACCKGAYAGQVSGKCLSELESPPTTSPTGVGGLDVWYPDYDTAWTEAGCINDSPLPSGRPTYSTRIACCKGAYGGQVSGVCLSQLDSPPTTSPTGIGGADFYYRDYSKGWSEGTCINDLPLPIQVTEWNTYSTKEECCKTAFGGQVSNMCVCSLDDKPTVCYEVKTSTITSTVDPVALGVTIPATLPTGTALTSLVTSLKDAIKAQLKTAGNEASDIIIVSINGVAVNQRRLGQALALRGIRALQENNVVYKAVVEYSCLPEECATVATQVQTSVESAICTAADKCQGTDACTEKTGTTGCSSCIGNSSCQDNNAVIEYESCVGENACRGVPGHPRYSTARTIGASSCRYFGSINPPLGSACTGFVGASIGTGSCNDSLACFGAEGSVGDNSCNGEMTCFNLNLSQLTAYTVGNGSCNAKYACLGIQRSVGDDECNTPCECCDAEQAAFSSIDCASCAFDGTLCDASDTCQGTDACTGKTGVTECYSCIGDSSCQDNNADIEYHSCVGENACLGLPGHPKYSTARTIGASSCRYEGSTDPPLGSACTGFVGASIGSFSCNDSLACFGAESSVGDNSCNGEMTCFNFNVQTASAHTIGNGSCNAKYACLGIQRSVGDDECNSPCECCDTEGAALYGIDCDSCYI